MVKKLMDAVKNTVPVIAEAMEAVRQKMIIFRYQLLHIGSGKRQITDTLHAVQPDIKRYDDVVKQLKAKIKEHRHAIRPGKERETAQCLQAAHGKKFDSGTLAQSRKNVAKMLDETGEPISIQQNLRYSYERQDKHYPTKRQRQER